MNRARGLHLRRRTAVIELNSAERAMVQLPVANALNQVINAASHGVDFIAGMKPFDAMCPAGGATGGWVKAVGPGAGNHLPPLTLRTAINRQIADALGKRPVHAAQAASAIFAAMMSQPQVHENVRRLIAGSPNCCWFLSKIYHNCARI
jgi:hypothetical protein